VTTGSVENASTDADVYVTLYGMFGQSQEFKLNNPNRNDFEAGRTDHFSIKGPFLGALTKLRVRHNNTGSGPGWFLNSIKVENECTGAASVFTANRWLALTEGDRQTEVMLSPTAAPPVPITRYFRLHVGTGGQPNAGTDAHVYAQITGTGGTSVDTPLNTPGMDDFVPGWSQQFEVRAPSYIGSFQKIRMRHDNTGAYPGWFLKTLTVVDECMGQTYQFEPNTWLALSEPPYRIEMTFSI
jgi:hypothetical protein